MWIHKTFSVNLSNHSTDTRKEISCAATGLLSLNILSRKLQLGELLLMLSLLSVTILVY